MSGPTPAGPECPRCGYNIFGLRDMRCPECGRVLDVRDFSVEGESGRGDARRYERTSAIAGVIACLILLLLIAPLVLLVRSMLGYGVISVRLVLVIAFLAVCLLGVIGQAFRDMVPYVKGFKNRR